MQSNECLRVEDFGVAFGEKVVLAAVDFSVAQRSMTVLMGPSGSGKSTLFRSLAGLNENSPRYACWGQVLYQGHPLNAQSAQRPSLVQQNARFLMSTVGQAIFRHNRLPSGLPRENFPIWRQEFVTAMGFPELAEKFDQPLLDLSLKHQRVVAILREVLEEPALLLVDEPTANLSQEDAAEVLQLLRTIQNDCALMVVVHNQLHAKLLGGKIILMAGGRVQEQGAVEQFLEAPQTHAGQQFVRTGSCFVASPDADPSTLAEDVPVPPPLPAAAYAAMDNPDREQLLQRQGVVPASQGPRGFAWLLPGKLAGTPMPGVVNKMEHDLAALRRCGITMLVTLTEKDIDQQALQAFGLRNMHLPVYDREPPSIAQLQMLTKRMQVLMEQGEVLAVHCLAGLGRTGTVLAAWLIYEGLTAHEALRRVRLIDAQYVQSTQQEQSLQHFEDAIVRKMI